MSDRSDQLQQIDQILLSFATLDEVKINEVISYDPSLGLFIELVQIFDSEMAEKIQLIKAADQQQQWAEVSKIAHRIRSTSLNLGATRLSEILKRIEYMALETPLIKSEIEFLINSLEKEFLAASQKLHAFVARPPGSV
jgi:HPt (histidine-containing phosphotransfer) domain-containing protein